MLELEQLNKVRQNIDAIDEQFLALLEQRSEYVASIIEIKRRNNCKVQDTYREEQIVKKITALNSSHYHELDLINIYRAIFKASLNQQLLAYPTLEE